MLQKFAHAVSGSEEALGFKSFSLESNVCMESKGIIFRGIVQKHFRIHVHITGLHKGRKAESLWPSEAIPGPPPPNVLLTAVSSVFKNF